MTTGLNKSETRRMHFDIYAVLEGPQEMYFGHEVQVNVNQVERVKIERENGELIQKCYLSPTKRRGVERRSLIWAPLADGTLLGDELSCGIPKTCTKLTCPICRVYGGLQPKEGNTFIGRLTHGGGVALQALDAEEKQRAMHPSDIVRDKDGETPTPFRREYNEPGLFYPVYNHALSVSEEEFQAVAYAFLDSLVRIGAGNPKGARLAERGSQPLLVVDQYLVPKGGRPVISPHTTDAQAGLHYFVDQAQTVRDGELTFGGKVMVNHFTRWTGDAALAKLQGWSEAFVGAYLA